MQQKAIKVFKFKGLTIAKLTTNIKKRSTSVYFVSETGVNHGNKMTLNGLALYPTSVSALRKIGLPGLPIKRNRPKKADSCTLVFSIGNEIHAEQIAKRA